ncbi:MAG: hypothetical protein ACRC3B_15750 [Bacteroidia bacterium]
MNRLPLLVLTLLIAVQLPAFPKWPKQVATNVYNLPWYAAPQVKAGYTFGAGFHWGWSIDIGLESKALAVCRCVMVIRSGARVRVCTTGVTGTT